MCGDWVYGVVQVAREREAGLDLARMKSHKNASMYVEDVACNAATYEDSLKNLVLISTSCS